MELKWWLAGELLKKFLQHSRSHPQPTKGGHPSFLQVVVAQGVAWVGAGILGIM
ncbi:MAG TPA: hypothetical protein VGY31_15165 [Terriglobia bacterium]|nr:hypothetical protein [Terriglobia bacterium]